MKRIKMLPVVLFIVALVIQPLYAFASTISKAGEETNHLVSTSTSSIEASFTDKSVQNPYVQQYLKEKDKSITAAETLVDPELEEKIIITTLTEYYNEDVKVANIIKKHQKDTNLMDKSTSLNKEDKINVMHAI